MSSHHHCSWLMVATIKVFGIDACCGQSLIHRCRWEVMHAPHVEPVGPLKAAVIGSQVTTSGVDLEIPSGPPWIKRTPLPGAPTIDIISLAVLRGVSHECRLIGERRVIKNKKAIETYELDRFRPSV